MVRGHVNYLAECMTQCNGELKERYRATLADGRPFLKKLGQVTRQIWQLNMFEHKKVINSYICSMFL